MSAADSKATTAPRPSTAVCCDARYVITRGSTGIDGDSAKLAAANNLAQHSPP